MSLPATILQTESELLHGVTITAARAGELAAEVSQINAAIRREAEARLTFDDEPSAFAVVLAQRGVRPE